MHILLSFREIFCCQNLERAYNFVIATWNSYAHLVMLGFEAFLLFFIHKTALQYFFQWHLSDFSSVYFWDLRHCLQFLDLTLIEKFRSVLYCRKYPDWTLLKQLICSVLLLSFCFSNLAQFPFNIFPATFLITHKSFILNLSAWLFNAVLDDLKVLLRKCFYRRALDLLLISRAC